MEGGLIRGKYEHPRGSATFVFTIRKHTRDTKTYYGRQTEH